MSDRQPARLLGVVVNEERVRSAMQPSRSPTLMPMMPSTATSLIPAWRRSPRSSSQVICCASIVNPSRGRQHRGDLGRGQVRRSMHRLHMSARPVLGE